MLQLLGENLGEAVEDYTNIVGAGRPPQGGNIDTGASDDAHAVCRADEHNPRRRRDGRADASSVPVMAEDAIVGHGSPIVADQVFCALGDFPAGSFTVAFLNDAIDDGFARRRGPDARPGGPVQAGGIGVSARATDRARRGAPAPSRARALPSLGVVVARARPDGSTPCNTIRPSAR